MTRSGTLIGTPAPMARVPVVVIRATSLAVFDAGLDSWRVEPETELTTVPPGMSGPLMGSVAATVEGKDMPARATVSPGRAWAPVAPPTLERVNSVGVVADEM